VICYFIIILCSLCSLLFFFNHPPTTKFYTLSLHDALPICIVVMCMRAGLYQTKKGLLVFLGSFRSRKSMTLAEISSSTVLERNRSEEHTSELQSRSDLVCRLLLEKKKKTKKKNHVFKKRHE